MLELQKFNDTENFDIICISETKVADKHSIKLPSYDCYRLDRTSQGGGVAIFVKSSLKHCEIMVPALVSIEAVGVKIYSENKTFTLISAYKAPKNKLHCSDLSKLLAFENSVVVGDLNCKNQAWNCVSKNSDGIKLLKYCVDKSIFIAAPNEPTHVPSNPRFKPSVILEDYN